VILFISDILIYGIHFLAPQYNEILYIIGPISILNVFLIIVLYHYVKMQEYYDKRFKIGKVGKNCYHISDKSPETIDKKS